MTKWIVGILWLGLSPLCLGAQEAWPRLLKSKEGAIMTIYQPQPEKLTGNILDGRTAFSIKKTANSEPVFGALWFVATMETNRDNRMAVLKNLQISDVRFQGVQDSASLKAFKNLVETEAPKWKLATTIDEITASLEPDGLPSQQQYNHEPPAITYVTTYAALVLIDGEPVWKMDDNIKMKRVINSAFLIVQPGKAEQYYLFGGTFWYSSSSVVKGWKQTTNLPKELQALDKQLKQQNDAGAQQTKAPAIIVSTKPAEIIQSEGEANFTPISGTGLLYVSNTDDHIFMHIASNQYYVLISGRWYTTAALTGDWKYVAPDQLPEDFAKIPKGSEKDVVLASVAGTEEAHDAVMDAQVPQTAKVDRKTATCTVKYDGDPAFEKIEGTSLMLAKNTSATVIQSGNTFFCVENGVWFKSNKATGPWQVSDERPKDVDQIPASSAAYNVKYVYVYESTPQYVYVGYTPGYMGCYVYGPVVIYGTGYYYNPWYGVYYYPRPVTYGFSIRYNPYTGWSVGFHYSSGFFSFHVRIGGYPGFWGPPIYRPPYYPRYKGGLYGPKRPVYIGGDVNINIDHSKNIYNNRGGISTTDIKRNDKPAPGNNALGANGRNVKNDVLTDRQGNVFKPGDKGAWQQRGSNSWQPAAAEATNSLNKQMENRERSQHRNQQFNHSKPASKKAANPKR